MKLQLFQIDAFTDQIFGGNPACVVPLEDWLPNETLLKIARENAVAETAFFLQRQDKIHLRWFTPEIEMDLCGHATLAAAHCLKSILKHPNDNIVFDTHSGDLTVSEENGWYFLNFPSRMPKAASLPDIIQEALNIQPKEVYKSRDYVLVYDSEEDVKDIRINRQFFDQINLDPGGVIVTAEGNTCDFVSRFFTPQASIFEDPVTGSAHCSLVPFWALKLKKDELMAHQISERFGILKCLNKQTRVVISGQAKTYSSGHLWIE